MPGRRLFQRSGLPASRSLNMLACDFFFANLFEGHPGSLVHIGILSNFARFEKGSCRETHCTCPKSLPKSIEGGSGTLLHQCQKPAGEIRLPSPAAPARSRTRPLPSESARRIAVLVIVLLLVDIPAGLVEFFFNACALGWSDFSIGRCEFLIHSNLCFLIFEADRFAPCEFSTLDALADPFLLVVLAFVNYWSLRTGRIFCCRKAAGGKNTGIYHRAHTSGSESFVSFHFLLVESVAAVSSSMDRNQSVKE